VTPGAAAKASLNRASSRRDWARSQVSYPWPGRSGVSTPWRPEPTDVAKSGDELWVGVKCQTNLDIAGSPRNSFGVSAGGSVAEVEHRIGKRAYRLSTRTELRMPPLYTPVVGQWGMSLAVERETAQTAS
jgi:hypothetical protein